jgi:hypothetical protein
VKPKPWAVTGRPRVGSGAPGSLLRRHPALLLTGTPADAEVRRLVREWNPAAVFAVSPAPATSSAPSPTPATSPAPSPAAPTLPATSPGIPAENPTHIPPHVEVAEGVRWAGPFRLDPETLVDAGLEPRWTTAYAALCARGRTRVPDGIDADRIRLRYPHGLPVGTEGVAWSLVTGLARLLGGAIRLPAESPRATRSVAVQRVRAQENVYCVYGHEALPWSVLRSVLSLSLPELDRNGALAANDYCLDRPGGFEVRVRPFSTAGFVPYALRPRTAADWPGTVYSFHCLPQATDADAERVDAHLRTAACQLADVVGGLVLDGEGFPLSAAVTAAR